MTALEMQKNFQIRSGRQESPVNSEDIFYFLNKAQLVFVREKFEKKSQGDGSYFEATQAISDELKPLVASPSPLAASYAGDSTAVGAFKADYVEFAADHMYLLNQRAKLLIPSNDATVAVVNGARAVTGETTTSTVNLRLSQVDDIYRLLDDPFNTTTKTNPIAEISKGGLVIYTKGDEFIVDEALVVYLRKPKEIKHVPGGTSQPCELPTFVHEDIVDLAVNLFNESGKSTMTETETAN